MNKQNLSSKTTSALSYLALILIFGLTSPNAFGQWSTSIGFNEAGFDPDPINNGDHPLIDADMGATSFSYSVDVVAPVAASVCADGTFSEYEEDQDGTDDIMISITVVRNVLGPGWNNDEVDWDDAGAFRHKFNIGPLNNGSSVENDFSYAVIEVTFLNGLVVDSDNLCFSSTSTNGSSEFYEYGLFYANNALNPAGISSYTNDIYGGCNAAIQTSMGNFLLGNIGTVSEGNIAPGVYTDDGLNTSVSCPPVPEAATTNPGAGNGPSNGASNITGAMMGLAAGTPITSFTAVLGLHDVAYDTDGNGFTNSNSNPAARFSNLCIGNSMACPMCPDMTTITTPVAIIASESDCSTGALAGGMISAPTTTCPDGTTLEYSYDNGTSWLSSFMDSYDQTASVTVMTRCICDIDDTLTSAVETIDTNPGTCCMITASVSTPALCGEFCANIATVSISDGTTNFDYAYMGPTPTTGNSSTVPVELECDLPANGSAGFSVTVSHPTDATCQSAVVNFTAALGGGPNTPILVPNTTTGN